MGVVSLSYPIFWRVSSVVLVGLDHEWHDRFHQASVGVIVSLLPPNLVYGVEIASFILDSDGQRQSPAKHLNTSVFPVDGGLEAGTIT
jgi:hypothetical protein